MTISGKASASVSSSACNCFARHRLAGILGDQPDHDIAQLAHVAGEGVNLPHLLRRRREQERHRTALSHIEIAEMLQQQRLVLPHVTQRRHADGEDAETVIKVGTEVSGLDFLTQIAIGRGDDARVAVPRLGFADTLKLAVFQHAQQLGLQLHRQFADFVEKQGAVAGILEITGARSDGAGKGAFAVTEQGRLDQGRGNRCAIERQKGFLGARAEAVQASRHQFLAAAGFALDQHREGRIGKLADLLAQFFDIETVAEDIAGARRFRCALPALPRACATRRAAAI